MEVVAVNQTALETSLSARITETLHNTLGIQTDTGMILYDSLM